MFNDTGVSTSIELNRLTISGDLDPARATTELRLPDGCVVHIPTALLVQGTSLPEEAAPIETAEGIVFPLIEEQLNVGKRTTETGKVLIQKRVHEYKEALDVPLAVRSFDIERIVINQPVEAAPAVRQEGSTTIYPLVEEQLILTTQLILKEELRVTQRDTERRDTRTVTLKRESIEVARIPAE